MVTRFDDFFTDLIGPRYVQDSPGRFEWGRGYLKAETGSYYMVTIPETDQQERQVFQYLIDNATKKWYIAHNPVDMGPNFFIAAIVTPINLCGSVIVQLAKLVVTSIKVIYQTFSDIYPNKSKEEISTLTLRSFEENLDWQKNEIFNLIEGIFDSFKYAAGLEIAALYGVVFFQDHETISKMQAIFSEIDRQWNHEIDYKETPFSYAVRFKRLLEQGDSVQEALTQLKIENMKPGFYVLQCCQERHGERIEEFGGRYTSYDEMQLAIREEAHRHAQIDLL
jgi:hypothetical protein